MADTDRLAKEIAGILRSSGSRQTKAYDTPAVVRRVDGNTAWVHIPGGVDETPVQLTVAAEPGDTVQVRVSGGMAWIVGNASAPPTDDKAARAAQETADVAVTEAEAASERSAEARQVARAAAKIAGDTEQHFWFTETGADTGAHITEKTQEDFLADPDNGGGNLLARSNGIALREGMIELATLQQSGMDINTYTGGGTQINIAHLGYGPGTAEDGSTDTQPYYTLGTRDSLSGIGNYSMAEGYGSWASGYAAHAEGGATRATGQNSHSEGNQTRATGQFSHAEGSSTQAIGDYSHSQNRQTVAQYEAQTVIGKYNYLGPYNDAAFVIGAGDSNTRKDAFVVDWDGTVSALPSNGLYSQILTLGWWNDVKNTNEPTLFRIQQTLEKILDRLSLFDAQLVTGANWSSGTLTVPGSSKYRVFEVIQGGAAVVAFRYGNDLRGFALSGNASSGNYNQYVRAFGATANWSTEVWTLQWAKQLSHVTTSSYHTSGTEQAITEIRGLIPLQNA